jgi:shikimate dehydrogenase
LDLYPFGRHFPTVKNRHWLDDRLPWTYTPLDVTFQQLKTVIGLMKELPARGANVTVPYKEDVRPHLDRVEGEARWLGSVNTIYRQGSRLYGTSTDGEGFLRSLGPLRKTLKGSRGLLVGAGGAAKAVAGALARSGVKSLYLSNRSAARAEYLARALKSRYTTLRVDLASPAEAEKVLPHCDWVIQATSVGLKKEDPSPLSLRGARPSLWVVDLIYHRETAFLRQAKNLGLRNLDGIGMLLHQGALSFERWTGKKAPLSVMRKALLNSLG